MKILFAFSILADTVRLSKSNKEEPWSFLNVTSSELQIVWQWKNLQIVCFICLPSSLQLRWSWYWPTFVKSAKNSNFSNHFKTEKMKRILNSQISAKRVLDKFKDLCMEAYMILTEVPTITHQFHSLHKCILLPNLLCLLLVMKYKSITHSQSLKRLFDKNSVKLTFSIIWLLSRKICKSANLDFDDSFQFSGKITWLSLNVKMSVKFTKFFCFRKDSKKWKSFHSSTLCYFWCRRQMYIFLRLYDDILVNHTDRTKKIESKSVQKWLN